MVFGGVAWVHWQGYSFPLRFFVLARGFSASGESSLAGPAFRSMEGVHVHTEGNPPVCFFHWVWLGSHTGVSFFGATPQNGFGFPLGFPLRPTKKRYPHNKTPLHVARSRSGPGHPMPCEEAPIEPKANMSAARNSGTEPASMLLTSSSSDLGFVARFG